MKTDFNTRTVKQKHTLVCKRVYQAASFALIEGLYSAPNSFLISKTTS